MSGYQVDDATPDEIEAERATYAPIADVTRRLADLSIRTRVSPEEAASAHEHLEAAIALLSKDVADSSYGVRYSRSGVTRDPCGPSTSRRNGMGPGSRFARPG